MGRAIALRYAQEGATVVIGDLRQADAQKVVDEITGSNGKAKAVAVDVRNQQQVQTLIDTAVNPFGGLGILAKNAGLRRIIPFFRMYQSVLNFFVEVISTVSPWCTLAGVPVMIKLSID